MTAKQIRDMLETNGYNGDFNRPVIRFSHKKGEWHEVIWTDMGFVGKRYHSDNFISLKDMVDELRSLWEQCDHFELVVGGGRLDDL